MEFQAIFSILCSLIGGLFIFLLGMKYMSEGTQAVAGENLRRMISAVTDKRLIAVGVGAMITSIIQSSSVTSVMVIGLVNAGVMTLTQAIGVILGADIGTTITAWIVSLDVLGWGLPVLGLAGFVYLFAKRDPVRFTSMAIMGIGMVFFGLELMKDGLMPIRSNEYFLTLFARFKPDDCLGVLKCVLVGSAVTALVQSSSATVAITITLARTGVIGYDSAVALVLGENIGTTMTAFLASIGTHTNARRVAFAHILTKTTGVALMVPLFFVYMRFLNSVTGDHMDIAKRIAFSHSVFNIFLVVLFLPLVGVLAALLRKMVPDKPYKESPHLTKLDVRLLDSPLVSIEQSRSEILLMGENVAKMFSCLRDTVTSGEFGNPQVKMLFRREEILDTIQKEVVEFLTSLLGQELPHAVAEEARGQMRRADEYESVSDNLVGVLKHHLRLRNAGLKMAHEEATDVMELHDAVAEYFALIYQANQDRNKAILTSARPQGDAITHLFREKRSRHLARLSQKTCDPLLSTSCMDILSTYRRIKDHLLNVAEALAGVK